MEKVRWSKRLFAIWVAVGICWAGTACVISHMCPECGPGDRTLRKVGKTPQEDAEIQAWHDKIEWCGSRLFFLAFGSLAFAQLGMFAFYRRHRVVFILAIALISVCWLAMIAISPLY
jgi:hypothetical protein